MDLGLYDSDLSLFGGDLLVGLPPTSAELKVTQDVESYEEVTSPWATTTHDLDVSLGQHELADSTSFSNPVVVDKPLELPWMDSRVDLLDLLAQNEDAVVMDTSPVEESPIQVQNSAPGDDAVKLLQSVAEETTQMLAAAAATAKPGDSSNNSNSETLLSTATVVAQAADTLQSVVHTEDGMQTSVDHLLDMLASGLDPGPEDLDLGSMSVVDSDILASVSAEEVESLLSSEPSSPAVPYFQESSFSEDSFGQGKKPEQSNSLLAQYLLGDFGTNPSRDVSDLESLTSDNLSDDDSDYVPSGYRASKTRSSPYARKNVQSNCKTVLSRDARAQDKKTRKKQQNKDAATRYRQKKREEAELIDQECNVLEDRNNELKDKVEQMTREIGYLKNLLAEVYKARALIKKKK